MEIKDFVASYGELFNGETWYGNSIMKSLENVAVQFWNEKPKNTKKTIAEIVCHIIDWRYFVIEKLKENTFFDIKLNSKADWRENVSVRTTEEKESMFSELKKSQETLIGLVKEKDTLWLEEKTMGKAYSNKYMLEGILQHDVYHLGQINLINSQLKTE